MSTTAGSPLNTAGVLSLSHGDQPLRAVQPGGAGGSGDR